MKTWPLHFTNEQRGHMTTSKRSEALAPGLVGHAETTVTAQLTAPIMGSGTSNVYASPAVVALMEAAAVACADRHLAPGETTLGVRFELNHKAATPPGMKVSAKATLVEIDGRKLTFAIEAYDAKEQIADAKHIRIIVDHTRFAAKVEAKAG